MSYELLSDTMDLTMSEQTWRNMLDLALMNGWVAAGTLPPDYATQGFEGIGFPEKAWGGSYSGNDWQRVTVEDARSLAAALGRALPLLDSSRPGGAVGILRPAHKKDLKTMNALLDVAAAIERGELIPFDEWVNRDWNPMDLAPADVELIIAMATSGGGFIIA